jgi:16S rRNA (guanine527-N7)-methyltransferase
VTSAAFTALLLERAEANQLQVPAELADKLAVYFQLLSTWSLKMNLAGFPLESASAEAIDRLFIEPLNVAAAIEPPVSSLIDIGSGGGSPALPFALATMPQRLTLVESRGRKATFLREAARVLGISERTAVINCRYEELAGDERLTGQFDVLLVRAVKVDSDALGRLSTFVRRAGRVVVFGGLDGGGSVSHGLLPLQTVQLPGGSQALVYQR